MKRIKMKTTKKSAHTDAKILRFIQQFFYEYINIHSFALVNNCIGRPYYLVEILGVDNNPDLSEKKVYSLNEFFEDYKAPSLMKEKILKSACADLNAK